MLFIVRYYWASLTIIKHMYLVNSYTRITVSRLLFNLVKNLSACEHLYFIHYCSTIANRCFTIVTYGSTSLTIIMWVSNRTQWQVHRIHEMPRAAINALRLAQGKWERRGISKGEQQGQLVGWDSPLNQPLSTIIGGYTSYELR